MESLFPPTVSDLDLPAVPGLRFLPNYIDEAEERAVVAAIDAAEWNTAWQRRRQFYGSGYGNSGPASPMPEWGCKLADRMFAEVLTPTPFDHMLVNEYQPGQGIHSHRDYLTFGSPVVSLSLLSPCVLNFRDAKTERVEHLLLPRRSLLLLGNEARYRWEHGIAARKSDAWNGVALKRGRRLSVTFRFATAEE